MQAIVRPIPAHGQDSTSSTANLPGAPACERVREELYFYLQPAER